MKVGDPLKPASIDKFLTIHKLFDHGHFKLDMKKAPTDSGNANDVWVYIQKQHIDDTWKQLQHELKLKEEKDKIDMKTITIMPVTPNKTNKKSKEDLDKKPKARRLVIRSPRGKRLRIPDENDDDTYEQDIDNNKKSTKPKKPATSRKETNSAYIC